MSSIDHVLERITQDLTSNSVLYPKGDGSVLRRSNIELPQSPRRVISDLVAIFRISIH